MDTTQNSWLNDDELREFAIDGEMYLNPEFHAKWHSTSDQFKRNLFADIRNMLARGLSTELDEAHIVCFEQLEYTWECDKE